MIFLFRPSFPEIQLGRGFEGALRAGSDSGL